MSVESHPFYRTALDLAEEAANSLTPAALRHHAVRSIALELVEFEDTRRKIDNRTRRPVRVGEKPIADGEVEVVEPEAVVAEAEMHELLGLLDSVDPAAEAARQTRIEKIKALRDSLHYLVLAWFYDQGIDLADATPDDFDRCAEELPGQAVDAVISARKGKAELFGG